MARGRDADGPRRHGPARRAFVWAERVVLSIGMTLVAAVIERRLIKAIKQGLKPAPRTAAWGEEQAGEEARLGPERERSSAAAADEVGQESQR